MVQLQLRCTGYSFGKLGDLIVPVLESNTPPQPVKKQIHIILYKIHAQKILF